MALRTYDTKILDKPISYKMKKSQAERLHSELSKVTKLNKYCKELNGIKDVKESDCILWSPFQSFQIEDITGYNQAVNEYVASLPETITLDNYKEYAVKANEIFKTYIPIVDKRRTKQDEIIRQAEVTAVHAQMAAELNEWRQVYSNNETVNIPDGSMAVYLEITFDDSDMMTDYFNNHCQIGDDLLLALVPKQPEKQALCRRILSRYPELNKLQWEWKTENYSMGHGNYLISEWSGTDKRKAYDGREEVMTRYEIRCNAYSREMLAYRDYPGTTQAETITDNPDSVKAEIRHNKELDGIEVIFPEKPSQSILDTLRDNGFRWSRFNKLWYTKYNEDLLYKINAIINN